jgi:hypothetical protein
MAARVLLIFIGIWLATACKNEPYEEPPLGVTRVTNHVVAPAVTVTLNYYYRNGKLYTYSSTGTVTTSMKFAFEHDELKSIVTDSTDTARKVTTFYNRNYPTVTDTTLLYNTKDDTVSKASARVVTFDGDGNPTSVDIKTWTTEGITEKLAELTWEAGNVTRLVTYNFVEGEKSVEKDLAIAYDGATGIYATNREYLYTMPLDQLYWLSKNNPITFNDGTGDKTYVYWFNKLGYPSNYQDNTGIVWGATYTKLQ